MTTELIVRAILSGILMGAIYGVLGMGFTLVYGIVDLPLFTHGVFALWGCTYYSSSQIHWRRTVSGICVSLHSGVCVWRPAIQGAAPIHPEHRARDATCVCPRPVDRFDQLGLDYLRSHIDIAEIELAGASCILGEVSLKTSMIVGAGVSVAFVIGMETFFRRTETGKTIRACADNRRGALIIGLM